MRKVNLLRDVRGGQEVFVLEYEDDGTRFDRRYFDSEASYQTYLKEASKPRYVQLASASGGLSEEAQGFLLDTWCGTAERNPLHLKHQIPPEVLRNTFGDKKSS